MHKSYLEAGAEIIITSSYQASLQGFHDHMSVEDDKAMQYMESSVILAREAIDEYCSQPHVEG